MVSRPARSVKSCPWLPRIICGMVTSDQPKWSLVTTPKMTRSDYDVRFGTLAYGKCTVILLIRAGSTQHVYK